MPGESRLAQLATSPLVQEFAVAKSQSSIRKVGAFLAPFCKVADLTFHYKEYDALNQFRIPDTKRQPGGGVTRLTFKGLDRYDQLEPNALDLPLPSSVAGLSDQAVQFNLMEGMGVLADACALSLEYEQISLGVKAAADNQTVDADWSAGEIDPVGDEEYGIDQIIKKIMLAAPGVQIKVLFGPTAFLIFKNSPKITNKFIVGSDVGGGAVGTNMIDISMVSQLLFGRPKVDMAAMVMDNSAPGTKPTPEFVLDSQIMVYASNDTPSRMDASFMKTFALWDGFFKPGTYMTQRQDEEVAKMDWITKPKVTNKVAAVLIDVS